MIPQSVGIIVPPSSAATTGFAIPAPTDVTLHIGNLDKSVDEARLVELFSRFGKVKSVKIVKDMYTQESKGFGFIVVSNQQEAEQAKQALNHEKIGRKEIMISLYKKPSTSEVDLKANIMVKNLDRRVTGRQLEAACSKYGKVLDCRIKDDLDGNSLGYGYVQFENEEASNNCIQNISKESFYDKQLSAEAFIPKSKRATGN